MKNSRWLYVATIALGVISLAMFALERLAIIDIFHGREEDLRLEWNVVHLAFLPVLVFHILAIAAAARALKAREAR